MPRVLLTGFCAVPGPRRAGVQLRHVIRALTPLHSVDLLVAREGDQPYVERQGSVRVLRVPTHESDLRSQIQAFQRALKRQLEGADYDVVHCRDSWSGIPVLDARARLGYAVVYDLTRSPHGETTYEPELDAQYARDEETCLAEADMVLAPSPAAMAALARIGKPDRAVLSPVGVDVDRFDWEAQPSGGAPRILYVGSIDPGRGVRVLVRAMAAIVRESDARLMLAGSMAPKFDQPLRDAIRELGLVDRVEVIGPVDHDQLPALIATATVCVVPAAADLTPTPTVVFPTKLLEYMACRRAIVAPRRETLLEVVENNREALLFEPGDPADLARKVLRLLAEPALRERIAQHAYDRVRREFTASAARRSVRTAYHIVVERFAVPVIDPPTEEAPKLELLGDDDFEATVFEEAPGSPPIDTAVNKMPLEDALSSLAAGDGENTSTSSGLVIAPPPSGDGTRDRDDGRGIAGEDVRDESRDETIERAPVIAGPHTGSSWSGPAQAPLGLGLGLGQDDWSSSDGSSDIRVIEVDDVDEVDEVVSAMLIEEGTPAEGVVNGGPRPASIESSFESSFVAGEIDVPTPPSLERDHDHDHDTPAVELTPRRSRRGSDVVDPDPGARTPTIERR